MLQPILSLPRYHLYMEQSQTHTPKFDNSQIPHHIHKYLCAKDLQWLRSCKHPQKRWNFLKARWMISHLIKNPKPQRLTNGYMYMDPYEHISISYKNHMVAVGQSNATLSHKKLLFGIDLEQTHVSERLAKRLLTHFPDQNQQTFSKKFLAALAFSGTEAIYKALGRYNQESLAKQYHLRDVQKRPISCKPFTQEFFCTFENPYSSSQRYLIHSYLFHTDSPYILTTFHKYVS